LEVLKVKGEQQSMVDDPSMEMDADRGKGAGIHSREIDREVSVAEVMNKAVIVMDINSDIPAIAREMVSRDAGSVIITKNGMAMGIVSELLSTPLVTIEPEATIVEASEIMLKANIKRLPVLKDGMIIGVISNTDILIVTPGLNTILKDLIDMNREALLTVPSIEEISEAEDFSTGVCESCTIFSYDLKFVDGRYLCGNCRQEEGEDYE
jgi:CBS domain-containing protein